MLSCPEILNCNPPINKYSLLTNVFSIASANPLKTLIGLSELFNSKSGSFPIHIKLANIYV